jgi:signal peptidase I
MTANATSSVASAPKNETVEVIKTVVYALLIALVVRVIVFQPVTIPSASMEPNLYEGDYVYVSKYDYGWSKHSIPLSPPLFHGRVFEHVPKRGDIIVFKLPRDGHTDYIKRVIGLPGDRIQMKGGLLYINDKQLPRQAAGMVQEDIGEGLIRPVWRFIETNPEGRKYMTNDFGPNEQLDNTDVYVVPEHNYFMMGDNRDNSLDSRVPTAIGVGYVPAENLVGQARMVLLSWKPGSSILKPWTWLNLRWDRFFKPLH